MERLKITAISLSITVLTFMFGPLVLSALLYYAYTYCEDRPEAEFEIKPISSLYVYAFIALPFFFLYISKQLGVQNNVIEVLKYIFSFKLIGFYGFDLSVKNNKYIDNISIVFISHVLSIFTVYLFLNKVAKYRSEKHMGFDRFLKPNENIKNGSMSDGKIIYGRVVFFLLLSVLVSVYYFAFPDKKIDESVFYKDGVFNVIFFPVYVFLNLIYFSARK